MTDNSASKFHTYVFGNLSVESAYFSAADLADAIGKPDYSYSIGDLRSASVPGAGAHKHNGVIFKSKPESGQDPNAQLQQLIQIALSIPEYLKNSVHVQIRASLFVQTNSWKSINVNHLVLKELAENNVALTITFD